MEEYGMRCAEHREFKDRLYEQFARIGKALSSPRRLEMVDLLAQGERNVEGLAGEMGLPVASVSQHLQSLKAARLVESSRRGSYAYYRLADESVFDVWRALRELGSLRLAEVERIAELYLEDRRSLEAVGSGELLRRLGQEGVGVLDVSPEEEYRAGHIPGARSVPVERVEAFLQGLEGNEEIVAYCRGPYCVFSDEAVRLLGGRGYRARRLSEGFPEWRAAGMPVEK